MDGVAEGRTRGVLVGVWVGKGVIVSMIAVRVKSISDKGRGVTLGV